MVLELAGPGLAGGGGEPQQQRRLVAGVTAGQPAGGVLHVHGPVQLAHRTASTARSTSSAAQPRKRGLLAASR